MKSDGDPDFATWRWTFAPAIISAVSRKVHGNAGAFEIDLPLIGPAGIECRNGGGSQLYQVFITFAAPVTLGSATLSAGTGSVSNSGVNGSTVTLNLSGVTSPQVLSIALAGVTDGSNAGDVILPMGVVVGDTNDNRTVNSADAQQTRNRSGQLTAPDNFRSDVNADGAINSGDAFIVRARSGSGSSQ